MSDVVGQMMAYEDGELDDTETLELFSKLIKGDLIRALQGSYGRTAADLIARGLLTPDGNIP